MNTIVSAKNTPTMNMNWVINKQADLLFLIGGALSGYFMFFLHAGLGLNMVVVWFYWVVLIDTPHFYGTWVRTYMDKEERKGRSRLLYGSLLWLVLGPVVIGIMYLAYAAGVKNYTSIFLFFVLFFNLWAYWHVTRQHWGVLALYKKKNNDFAQLDTRLDKTLLYGGLLAPLAALIVRHPEARAAIGIGGAMPVFPESWSFASLHWEHYVMILSVVSFSVFVLAFVVRQFMLWRQGQPLNVPKNLFFIALIPLYSYINYSDAVLTAPLLGYAAFITVYHDFQYHAIVWFYSKNRYHKPGAEEKYGFAAKVTRNFASYIFAGILISAVLRYVGCALDVFPGCSPMVETASYTLFGTITVQQLLYSIFIGVALNHYFVDQYIWRPGKDKKLRKELNLPDQQPA